MKQIWGLEKRVKRRRECLGKHLARTKTYGTEKTDGKGNEGGKRGSGPYTGKP